MRVRRTSGTLHWRMAAYGDIALLNLLVKLGVIHQARINDTSVYLEVYQ